MAAASVTKKKLLRRSYGVVSDDGVSSTLGFRRLLCVEIGNIWFPPGCSVRLLVNDSFFFTIDVEMGLSSPNINACIGSSQMTIASISGVFVCPF